jgi:hypothetical protein
MDPAEDPNLLIEGEGEPQDEDQNEEIIANRWGPEEAQYQFNGEEDSDGGQCHHVSSQHD